MSRENQVDPANGPTVNTPQERDYSARDFERIRELAYAAYSARLGGPGDALSDWLEAERMFLATTNIVAISPVSRSMPIQTIPARPAEARPPRQQRSGKSVTV